MKAMTWPTHPNGTRKTVGEMTPIERSELHIVSMEPRMTFTDQLKQQLREFKALASIDRGDVTAVELEAKLTADDRFEIEAWIYMNDGAADRGPTLYVGESDDVATAIGKAIARMRA